jgi:hypothetical protein
LSAVGRASEWTASITAVVIAILISIVYLFNQSNKALLDFSVAMSPIILFGAFLMSASTVISVGVRKNDRASLVWFTFMLALLLWFLSEVTSSYYRLALGMAPPLPSLADGFDLIAYLPLMIGVLVVIWPFRAEILAGWEVKGVWLVLAIFSVLVFYLLLPLMFRSRLDFAGVVVSLASPIFDLIGLFIAIPCVVLFGRGTFWRPYLILIAGLVVAAVGDIYYGFASLSGTYYVGHPVELVFDLAFISVALGFYLRRKQYLTKSI